MPTTPPCTHSHPIVLEWQSTDNPIVCSYCNDATTVENLPDNLKQHIENWNQGYEKAWRLWLEEDILEDLQNPDSELNKLGFAIVAELNKQRPTYYWWHKSECEIIEKCPRCSKEWELLHENSLGATKICKTCSILLRDA